MFEELMPLLAQRMLILTLSRVSDEKICVNVIPKPMKSDQRDDDAALTTPLAVTGTPKELDEQLPRQLVEFVGTHLELSSTLKSAKELRDFIVQDAVFKVQGKGGRIRLAFAVDVDTLRIQREHFEARARIKIESPALFLNAAEGRLSTQGIQKSSHSCEGKQGSTAT
jgi:PRTRC genetic system protein E